MKKSRLITIFNTFTKKEVRELRKWLLSPAHNQREDTVKLFDFIVKNMHSVREHALSKERAFKSIFPKQKYDDALIRQSMHFLLKVIDEFLIFKELRNDEVRSLTALASVYRKRKLEKNFEHTINLAFKTNEAFPYRNEHYLRNRFLIELEKYALLEKRKRTTEMNLQDLSEALEISFLANKMKYSNVMHAHQTVYKTDYNFGVLTEVLNYIEHSGFLKIPSIAIYYFGYKANSDKENPDHFQNLKTHILKFEKSFPPSELRDIYLMAINYCISQLNAGKSEFVREAFEMYQNGFKNNVLIENDLLSRFTFMNVIPLGLKLGEFEWVEAFIHDFKQYLEPKHRESVVHFSLANLAYEKKDYPQSMQLLSQVEYDDILMNLNAKRMLMKMLYEEEEYDALESLLDSLRTYLQRKKVMGYHKSIITNLIKLTKSLLKLNPYDQEQKDKFKLKVQTTQPLTESEKQWLFKQIDIL